MAEILLDGLALTSLEEVHRLFDPVLPPDRGRNLDALFDALGDLNQEVTVRLLHPQALEERLGRRGRAIKNLLRRAAEENERLTLLEE